MLVKSDDLSPVAVFEFYTIRYDIELFYFVWNKRGNLEGFYKKSKMKQFVWQPNGSQFIIIEEVPEETLLIGIKQPKTLDKSKVLEAIGFDKSWVTIDKV